MTEGRGNRGTKILPSLILSVSSRGSGETASPLCLIGIWEGFQEAETRTAGAGALGEDGAVLSTSS